MIVNTHISDLFFNTDHGDAIGHDDLNRQLILEVTAEEFISSMVELGIECPTVEELVADFINRL